MNSFASSLNNGYNRTNGKIELANSVHVRSRLSDIDLLTCGILICTSHFLTYFLPFPIRPWIYLYCTSALVFYCSNLERLQKRFTLTGNLCFTTWTVQQIFWKEVSYVLVILLLSIYLFAALWSLRFLYLVILILLAYEPFEIYNGFVSPEPKINTRNCRNFQDANHFPSKMAYPIEMVVIYCLNSSQFNLYLVYDSLVANPAKKFSSHAFILF